MSKQLANTKVLFIVRNAQGLSSLIGYFTSLNIKVWTVSKLKDAAQKILDNKIQVVFLSINLKDVLPKEAAEKVQNALKVPVILFAEDPSRRMIGEMARIDYGKKVEPPNQNGKFMKAMQEALSGSGDGKNNRARRENLVPLSAKEIAVKDVPDGGRWVKLNDVNAVPPFTFKQIPGKNSRASKARYYYVGDGIPNKDAAGKFYASGQLVQYSAAESSKGKMPYQFELGEGVAYKLSQIKNEHKEPTTRFEECLQEAAMVVERDEAPLPPSKDLTKKFMVSLVKTTSGEGYLMTALHENDVFEPAAFSDLIDKLRSKLEESSETITEMTPPLEFEQDMMEFIPWTKANSYFTASSVHGERVLTYIFISSSLVDVLVSIDDKEMFSVPSSFLRSDIPLTFDLFLHLEKNDRFVRYRRAGTLLCTTSLNSIDQHEVQKVFIRAEDKNSYYTFRASSFVKDNRKAQGF